MKGKRMLQLAGGAVTALLAAMGISFIGDTLAGENATASPARDCAAA